MSKLDQDFDKTMAQVNAKLKEAAKALSQATKLAEQVGYTNGLIFSQFNPEKEKFDWDQSDAEQKYDKLDEKYNLIDVEAFEIALEQAGWSSSSTYC